MKQGILATYRDADDIPVQPYFAAFMLENRIARLTVPQPERADRNVWFMAWLNDRWGELEAKLNFTWTERGLHGADMLDYLEQRAVDHVARKAVEAA